VTFSEVVDQVLELVRTRQRLSYRAFKRELELTEEYLEDLKEELRFSHPGIADEDGRGLVWTGGTTEGEKGKDSGPQTAEPGHWTPPHLAERIRAEQAALEARGATDGERKTITALFADLKGSTALRGADAATGKSKVKNGNR
jgi:hypothetical protein